MKLNNLSFRSKLLTIVVPLIGIILILLFLTSSFINNFSTHITELGVEELENQKRQTLLSEASMFLGESNLLLYQGKDALLKLSQNEDKAAENFLTQLEVTSGKILTITGQLLSIGKESDAKKVTENYRQMSNELKKWAEDINQKKLNFTEASDGFKKNRKLIKTFLKENLTFEEGKSSITPEILKFVVVSKKNFRLISVVFLVIIVFIGIFSTFILINMTKSLNVIINDLQNRFESLNKMSISISHQSNTLSAATQEQTASLQETASTMEEITSTIRNNVSLANTSKDEVLENSKLTTEGTNYVNEMITAVDDVKNVSEDLPKEMERNFEDMNKIVKVIQDIHVKTQVINDIVFQTKLLSFNASVEAARAGENGKGFSVVAEEIGKLAIMSGDAAKEISELLNDSTTMVAKTIENNKNQISTSVEKISNTAQLSRKKASECHEILFKISSKADLLTEMIESIVRASHEQATGAQEINTALAQLDQVSNQNYQTSVEVSASGEELKGDADELSTTISHLGQFLKGFNKKLVLK